MEVSKGSINHIKIWRLGLKWMSELVRVWLNYLVPGSRPVMFLCRICWCQHRQPKHTVRTVCFSPVVPETQSEASQLTLNQQLLLNFGDVIMFFTYFSSQPQFLLQLNLNDHQSSNTVFRIPRAWTICEHDYPWIDTKSKYQLIVAMIKCTMRKTQSTSINSELLEYMLSLLQ